MQEMQFDPWSQKIPCAWSNQAHVPQVLSRCSGAWGLQQVKLPHRKEKPTLTGTREEALLAATEESLHGSKDPAQAKADI